MRTLAVLLAVLLLSRPAAGQQDRLRSRLDAATATRVEEVLARATREGLPTEPLVQKALEGSAKGATPDHIVDAVAALARHLAEARAALGSDADPAALSAAAAALTAGIRRTDLAGFAALAEDRRAPALTAATGLLAAGVPATIAGDVVLRIVSAGGDEQTLLLFTTRVAMDVRDGVAADAAASARSTALLRTLPARPPEDPPGRPR